MANQRGKRSSQSSQKAGKHHPNRGGADPQRAAKLRIIAGTHRGRTLVYRGDPVTRPMKDRTREALFSRLGGMFQGGIAIDLFAGTGVLGFESLLRHRVVGKINPIWRSARIGNVAEKSFCSE